MNRDGRWIIRGWQVDHKMLADESQDGRWITRWWQMNHKVAGGSQGSGRWITRCWQVDHKVLAGLEVREVGLTAGPHGLWRAQLAARDTEGGVTVW